MHVNPTAATLASAQSTQVLPENAASLNALVLEAAAALSAAAAAQDSAVQAAAVAGGSDSRSSSAQAASGGTDSEAATAAAAAAAAAQGGAVQAAAVTGVGNSSGSSQAQAASAGTDSDAAAAAATAAASAARAPTPATTGMSLRLQQVLADHSTCSQLSSVLRRWAQLCNAGPANVYDVAVADLLPHLDDLLQSIRRDVAAVQGQQKRPALKPATAYSYASELRRFLQQSRKQLQRDATAYSKMIGRVQALVEELWRLECAAKRGQLRPARVVPHLLAGTQ